jgi:hypothetical protein
MRTPGVIACVAVAIGGCTEGRPATVGADCAVERADVTAVPRSGAPGSTVDVSGPLYYLNQEGEVWVPEHEQIQAWWNLDPENYAQAAGAAVEAATGGVAEPLPGGVMLVGADDPQGACSFLLHFTVPDVGRGTYPVSVVAVAGSDGSTTVYGSFPYEVR